VAVYSAISRPASRQQRCSATAWPSLSAESALRAMNTRSMPMVTGPCSAMISRRRENDLQPLMQLAAPVRIQPEATYRAPRRSADHAVTGDARAGVDTKNQSHNACGIYNYRLFAGKPAPYKEIAAL
jgi:hypothetical protein